MRMPVAELAGLNALTQGMVFKQTTVTDAAFREIDASKITRNIEAVQKKINTGRVQAGITVCSSGKCSHLYN